MNFTPEVAGTIAQILAVLLLATAFAPDIRGTLSKEWITGPDGRRHLVPTRRHLVSGSLGRFRYGVSICVLLVIMFDAICMMIGTNFDGLWGLVPIGINSGALGGLVGTVITTIRAHTEDATGNPQ